MVFPLLRFARLGQVRLCLPPRVLCSTSRALVGAGAGKSVAGVTVRPLVTIECADLPISPTFVVGGGIPRALWGTAMTAGAFARVSSLLAKEAFTALAQQLFLECALVQLLT